MNSFKSVSPMSFCAIIAAFILLITAAPAWAQHDMHSMPGTGASKSKPKSKSTAARKRQPKKRGVKGGTNSASSRSRKTPARKTGTDTQGAAAAPSRTPPAQPVHSPGHMNMQVTGQTPSSKPTPSDQAAPTGQSTNTPTHGPHGTHDLSASPSLSPQPSATPAQVQKHTDVPAQTLTADPAGMPGHKHTPAVETPQTPATPGANQANPHATHGQMGSVDNASAGGAGGAGHSLHAQSMNILGMVMGGNGRITSRTGSGTMWQPASTPMPMLHWMKGDWMVMLHADVKLGVNSQGGPRGVTKFESQNWLMAMASRKVGRGTLDLRGMFSLEPLTLSGGGSPQLFQTGETYQGRPLRDAQHPHDLFMTLSTSYTVPLGERGSWFAYFGLPGEPALGPVAFMHRASAAENPSAPLAHHLQDSTHISFGVFTTGFTYRWFKVEGSVFNGREPGENRYDIEAGPWNSRSFRVQFAPNRNWAAQVSYGFLKNPEALAPGDVRRTTASLSYNKQLRRGNWATTFVWGRNREGHGEEPSTLNGYTLESTLQFMNKNYVYTRAELVDKNGLLDDHDREQLGIEDHHAVFRIGAYTFGGARDIWETDKFTVALGGDVTFYSTPPVLDALYGSNPTSYRFFMRFRLGRMSTDASMRSKTAAGSQANPHGSHQE